MADYRLEAKNNQKKGIFTATSKEYPTNINGTLFNMAVGGVVTKIVAVVTKADSGADANGNADGKMDVSINGTTVATIDLTSTGIKQYEVTDLAGYTETGGVLNVTPGSDNNGDGTLRIMCEIIDSDATTGAYL